MYLVMLGPPGAGKGTQADLLSREYDIPHVSTGDMLRSAVADETKLGEKAQEYMDRGELVPDDVVIGITRQRLVAPDVDDGFVLDGFPRTVEQARRLDSILQEMGTVLDLVINLEVPESELIRRMTGRRICPLCGRNYHLVFNAPRSLGVCDECGSDLIQREDDEESVVSQRLKVYRETSEPLTDYYEDKGLLVNVDGRGPVEQVYQEIGNIIKS